MVKRIRGFIKNPGTTGESAYVGSVGGYHQTWAAGKAARNKQTQKIEGPSQPAE